MDFDYVPTQTFAYINNAGGNYQIKTLHFVLNDDPTINSSLGGVATVGKTYFGVEEVPVFSFGRGTQSSGRFGTGKKQACADYGYTVSQRTVLASVADITRVFLLKLSSDQWTVTSFNPRKKEVCIQIDTASGMNNITVALVTF